jgi:hypothetical protein
MTRIWLKTQVLALYSTHLLASFWFNGNAFAGSIRELCPLIRGTIGKINSPSTLEESICSLRDKNKSNSEALKYADESIEILRRLKQKESLAHDWREDNALLSAMQKLADSISNIDLTIAHRKPTPLNQALEKLLKDFGTKEKRASEPEAFRKSLESILSMTSNGKSLVSCAQQKGGNFAGPVKYEYVPGGAESGAMMQYRATPLPQSPEKFVRSIVFKAQLDPIHALVTYAHELKHVCNGARSCELDATTQSHPSDQEAEKSLHQFRVLDEMQAHRLEYRLFSEIAASFPELACRRAFVSNRYDGQIVTLAEAEADVEEKMASGVFADYLIRRYSGAGFFKLQHLSEMNSNGRPEQSSTGRLKLKPELIQALQNDGFLVK